MPKRSSQHGDAQSNTCCTTQGTLNSSSVSSTFHQSSLLCLSTVRSSVPYNTSPPQVDPSVPPPSLHPSLQLRTTAHLVSSSQSKLSTIANSSGTSTTFESKEPRQSRLRDAEHRRAILESDPHTEIVEPVRELPQHAALSLILYLLGSYLVFGL